MNARTLHEITGERPICQRCKKPLRPDTSSFMMVGHYPEPPSMEQVEAYIAQRPQQYLFMLTAAIKSGYQPERVHRIVLGQTFDGVKETEVRFWTGAYIGRGRGKDRAEPLYCNLECARSFAELCWNAGMRIITKEK
jgi:hypothetical protein